MTLRVTLSVVEIVLVVAVLAYFLWRLTRMLARTGDNLEKIAEGVKAVESHVAVLGPGTTTLNTLLGESAGNLERAASAAEQLGT